MLFPRSSVVQIALVCYLLSDVYCKPRNTIKQTKLTNFDFVKLLFKPVIINLGSVNPFFFEKNLNLERVISFWGESPRPGALQIWKYYQSCSRTKQLETTDPAKLVV